MGHFSAPTLSQSQSPCPPFALTGLWGLIENPSTELPQRDRFHAFHVLFHAGLHSLCEPDI